MKFKNLLTSIFLLPVVGIMGLLTGCGGSGTGGAGSAFVRWSAITPPDTVTVSGISTEASYTAPGPEYLVTGVTDLGISSNSSVSITYAVDESITAISITTPNGTIGWDEASGDILGEEPPLLYASNAGETSFAIAVNPLDPLVNWDYQTFGIWLDGYGTGSGKFGGISVGAPTAGSAIPTSSGADFEGLTLGAYVDPEGVSYLTVSDLVVEVDFGARELGFGTADTTIIDPVTAASSSASYLNMSGTLSYDLGVNSFTGGVTALGQDIGELMTGTAEGQFYGPNAEELGGVFKLTGTGEGSIESYSGAFGAQQVSAP